jgi:hypothetical protein
MALLLTPPCIHIASISTPPFSLSIDSVSCPVVRRARPARRRRFDSRVAASQRRSRAHVSRRSHRARAVVAVASAARAAGLGHVCGADGQSTINNQTNIVVSPFTFSPTCTCTCALQCFHHICQRNSGNHLISTSCYLPFFICTRVSTGITLFAVPGAAQLTWWTSKTAHQVLRARPVGGINDAMIFTQ